MNEVSISQAVRRPWRLGRKALATAAAAASLLGLATLPAAAAQKNVTPINVIVAFPNAVITQAPFIIGQETGYFAKQGLNIKIVVLTASTMNPALVSGSVQVGMQNATTLLQASAAGEPVQAISEYNNGVSVVLVLSTAYAQAHGITSSTPLSTVIPGLAGSIGGTSAASTLGQAAVLLRSYNVTLDQIHLVTFSGLAGTQAALIKGSINWYVSVQPGPYQAVATGAGIIVASSKNAKAWQGRQINQVMSVNTSYAASHPALMKRIVHAVFYEVKYVHGHSAQVVTPIESSFPGISRQVILKSLNTTVWATTPDMNENIWRSTVAFSVKSGQIPAGSKVNENAQWTNKYI